MFQTKVFLDLNQILENRSGGWVGVLDKYIGGIVSDNILVPQTDFQVVNII